MAKMPKNLIKIGFFGRGHRKMWKKKTDFLQKLPDTICVRKGEKTRIFVHTICFGQDFFLDQNSVNREKLSK